MKQSIFLVFLLVFIMSSCTEKEETVNLTSFEIQAEDVFMEGTNISLEEFDLFKRHNLEGIVPENYTYCEKIAETSETASVLLTEYEFTVPSHMDQKLERQTYFNQVLLAVKDSSDNKSVYKFTDKWEDFPIYEDIVPDGEKIECHFYLNGKLHMLTVTVTSSEDTQLYSVSLTYSSVSTNP